MKFQRSLLILLLVAAVAVSALAQSTATITGKVVDSHGAAIGDATVTLLELRRSVRAGADGTYRFANVAPGHYHVQAESARAGTALGEAEVVAGKELVIELVIDPGVHSEEIVVSASPDGRRESEVYQAVEVINDQELQERLQPSLGETLNQEPGVNSTYFGPGASRPIIRGLGADRIRVLEEGVGVGDASNVSPDHAVAVDPASAEQIEILRGPATLLYGSNAVGGVVNIVDGRVPSAMATQAITGHVDLRTNSVADERTGGFDLSGGKGHFAWHAGFSDRSTDDYEIAGQPDPDHADPDFRGFLENSSLESRNATFGASFVADRGYIGVAVSGFQSNYGIPGHEHGHGEEEEGIEEEEGHGVRIDLDQRRLDLKGELTRLGIFRNVRLRIGRSDYEHKELEGDEIGTKFTNESTEGRLEAAHDPIGRLRGSFGVQWSTSDFAAIGDEAFVLPNSTKTAAVFGFEEITGQRWVFQFGARYESQDISIDSAELPDRSFGGVSGSVGTLFRPMEGYAVALSVARAMRLPTAIELYADGPHAATAQFEIGDPNLAEEEALGVDLSFRKTMGRFRGTLNFFQNSFDGYIYEAPTDETEDDLPVFRFVQADARFRGIEVDTHTELWHDDRQHIELEAGGDFVNAELRDGGGNLPRIPPMRLALGLRYEAGPWSAWAEARRYFAQDDVADFETTTDGFTMVSAMLGYRFFAGNTVHDVMLRGTNLTDQLARVHTSPLKEQAPLPGRDFALSYRMTF